MAEAKPVKITMKMLADVKDADILLKYITQLGVQLKKVGGADADSLRRKLHEIKREMHDMKPADRTEAVVQAMSGRISGMMPDISKAKLFGSIDSISKEMNKFGTAQANAIVANLEKIKAALNDGEISQDTFDLVTASVDGFLEKAKKLPPAQLAKMGKDIRMLIANSQELGEAIQATSGIDFKIKLSGQKSVDELLQKINIAEAAQTFNDGIDEMRNHVDDFGESGKAIDDIRAKYEKLLKGTLSKASAKNLKAIDEELTRTAANLSGKELAKVGPVIETLIQKSRTFQDQLQKCGDAAIDGFDIADTIQSNFGLQVGRTEQGIVGILKRIPLIGSALKAIPMPIVLTAIAAVITGAKAIWDYFARIRDNIRNIQLGNIQRGLESINTDIDAELHLHQLSISAMERELEITKEREQATMSLKRAQLDLNKAMELKGLRTQEQRGAVERRYQEREDENTIVERKNELRNRRIENEISISNKEGELAIRREEAKRAREAGSAAVQRAHDAGVLSLDATLFEREKMTDHQKSLLDEAKNAVAKQKEAIKQQNLLEEELAKLRQQQAILNDKAQDEMIEMERKALAERREAAAIEESIRLAEVRAERDRAEELRRRSYSEKEREYQIGKSEVGNGVDIQIANQQAEYERWQARERSLQSKRDKFLIEWRKRNPTNGDMNETDSRLLNEITADLDEARQNRYSAQSRLDSLALQRRQSIHSRAREEELYEYDRDKQERDYRRGLRRPWQNLDEQIVEAKKELVRYQDEENEALEERERILRRMRAEGRVEMTQEEQTRFQEVNSDLIRARSSRYGEQSTIDDLEKQRFDRQFEESKAQYQREREDIDYERAGRYSRANYSQRLRMDIERFNEGRKMFEEAQARIEADNNGTQTLSPYERQIVERNRDEGREKMTSTRESIRSAIMDGDSQTGDFLKSLLGHGNRLTRMGLGGDVGNWDKQVASNTRKLVEQNKELLKSVNRNTKSNFGWGL